MKNKTILITAISLLTMLFGGCTASFNTGNGNANAAKPTNAAASPAAANKPAASNSNAPAKTELKNEKKPAGEGKTAKKDNPVPADWIYVYDETRGYGFSVPAGTTGENATENGVDVFSATTPAPSGIDMFVLAYKDKKLTKDDLLKDAVSFLEGMGQKVTPGALKADGGDYSVADATTVLEDGSKGKLRILVGTDVSDNYVMILGTDPDKFAANEKIIDEIWGSFEMWSGGASQN